MRATRDLSISGRQRYTSASMLNSGGQILVVSLSVTEKIGAELVSSVVV
jgi:hypothetical protein